jgi:LysM repeat protein
MRRILGIIAATLALASVSSSSWAGIDKAGTTAANFLSVGSGAEVLGMGGATLGGGLGLNAAVWNIAALGGMSGTEYVFSHASLNGASPQEWVAAGGRMGAGHTRWGLSALYQGDGTFDGRDASNNPTGSFSASSMALGGQIAQRIAPTVTAGLGLKYVSEKLGAISGGGVTFDAGLQVQAGPIGVGAAAQNAFGKMSYSGATFDFPTNYGLGLSAKLPMSGLSFAFDANFPTAYYKDVRGGFEWRWHDRLALRSGYRKELGSGEGEPLGGPTFGMGAGANGFWFDYGYLVGGTSGAGQHRVGLTFRPGILNGGLAALTPDLPRRHAEKPAILSEPKPASAPRRETREESALAPAASDKTNFKVAPAVTATPSRSTSPETAGSAAQAPAPITVKTKTPPSPASAASLVPAAPPVAAPANVKPASSVPASLVPAAPARPVTTTPAATPKIAPPATSSTPAVVTAPRSTPAVVTPPHSNPAVITSPPASTPAVVTAPPATAVPPSAPPAKAQPEPTVEPVKVQPAPAAAPATSVVTPPASTPATPPAAAATIAPSPPAATKPAPAAPATSPRPSTIKVKSGQTLADIARQWGVTPESIMMVNNLVSDRVKPGKTLKLPAAGH